jgi:hypothetical protein
MYFLHNTQLIMSARAIWYVAGTKRSPNGTLYMHCNVKPGASKNREGIASVDDEAVGICVAAQAREGEANKAVIKVLSEVCFSQYTWLNVASLAPNIFILFSASGTRPPQVRPAGYAGPQIQEQDCCCCRIMD